MQPLQLLSLPNDILILLPDYLHNIEDYMNLTSTCRALRTLAESTSAQTIMRLAAAQSKVFFRPSPHLLAAATARQLGHWARQSRANEFELATRMQQGIDGLFQLCVEHCGLTMERIRELHSSRFSIINPVTDLVDKCVGSQWYAQPDFWNTVDDAYTIDADPRATVFHLAIYGELFGPDFEAILNADSTFRRLSVAVRLEYIKYCLPDFASEPHYHHLANPPIVPLNSTLEPTRDVRPVGPYAKKEDGYYIEDLHSNNLALTWVLRSKHWKPHWKAMRQKASAEFQEDFDDGWWYEEDDEQDWRQRMWESVMICQGLRGFEMIRPEMRDGWIDIVKQWRDKISTIKQEPQPIMVGRQATHEYPYLLGDLRVCASGNGMQF